ncbi:MAG: type II secretion system F family protein [Candidatus Eremiobacteraeota bacterium]|nr:type II secretion system F family protein [Candidatus Eremiobacteraeota bacterium]
MPLYAYIATDRSGKKVQGYIDAASKSVAYQKVKARGLFPTKLDQDVSRASKAVAGESLAYSLLQLAALLKASIPLDEALDSIAEFDDDPAMRSAMKRVRVRLREGSTMTAAMVEEQAFPPMLIRMVQAGEESGKSAEILGKYAEFLKRDIEHRRALVSALSYPVALVVLSMVLMTGLLYFLTPVLKEMYGSMGLELPWITSVIVTIGEALGTFGPFVIPALIIGGYFFFKVFPRRALDRIKLSLPLVGIMLRCGLMEQWSRTLGMLAQAGVPLVRAMELARESLGNESVEAELEVAERAVERGDGLAKALARVTILPPLLHQFLRTGERTGELEAMLMSAAAFYERELERRRSMLAKFLEPALIIMMGIVVGILVLSVLLPLSQIASQLQV